MKAVMTIPFKLYKFLELQCIDKGPEFRLLKSGLIDGERVVILCEASDGDSLREWAERCSSGASAQISLVAESKG